MTEVSVRFFGGPLDGRVQTLGDVEPVSGTVMRHVHLHDGPKIETHYQLGYTEESGWEYRLCGLSTSDVDEV
ncbi:hypothetical protein HFP15_32610 [Amycolatopsis sp. K13G38]|uniref:Uncharacterized protein n=1 Tax=Amycolatopsis acididurans TaxID=2724524 RepID=A0ABX1JCW1_9PSEU|nr:hypothetical protein [Amycolatopsis acididurans]NKQ57615.1 hypothetical protein [Amycolatopsis acididurans]